MAVFALPGDYQELLIYLVGMAAAIGLYVYPLWRICERFGRPGYLALLFFVPLGAVLLLWILAFSRPSRRRVEQAHPADGDDGVG